MQEQKEKLMDQYNSIDQKGKFFTYSKPYSDAIDEGSFFVRFSAILYQVISVIFLALPLYVAYLGIDNKVFKGDFLDVLGPLIFFVAFSISCWISFQIFLNRKDHLERIDRDKGYLASSIMSSFVSTIGECIAVFYALAGTITSVYGLLVDVADDYLQAAYIYNSGGGFKDIIMFPIIAFLIVLFSRFFSELINATADIARNTKK